MRRKSRGCISIAHQTGRPWQPDCILSIGSQRLAAAVLNEEERDNTTLHVLIQANPLFWADETGVLQTPQADIEVRVSNIIRMESGDDHDSSVPAFRIGLEKLGQPTVKLQSQAVAFSELQARLKWPEPATRRPVRTWSPSLIAIVLVAALAVAAAVLRFHHLPQTPTANSSPVVISDEAVPSTPAKDHTPAYAAPEPTLEALQLPGVEPLLNYAVAKKLALTPDQTGAFIRLNNTTQEALRDLEKYWQSSGRLELARRREVLLEAAREEALKVLTGPQCQQWQAMAR